MAYDNLNKLINTKQTNWKLNQTQPPGLVLFCLFSFIWFQSFSERLGLAQSPASLSSHGSRPHSLQWPVHILCALWPKGIVLLFLSHNRNGLYNSFMWLVHDTLNCLKSDYSFVLATGYECNNSLKIFLINFIIVCVFEHVHS